MSLTCDRGTVAGESVRMYCRMEAISIDACCLTMSSDRRTDVGLCCFLPLRRMCCFWGLVDGVELRFRFSQEK